MTYVDDRPRGAHLHGTVPEGHGVVVFIWSTKHGHCIDCGNPAAFVRGMTEEQLALRNSPPPPHTLVCCLCAALSAAEGDTIVFLNAEYED
jgi:hypothetical protein